MKLDATRSGVGEAKFQAQSGLAPIFSRLNDTRLQTTSLSSITQFHAVYVAMGWFWGNSKDDPVNKLDPGLRDYLQRETPTQDYVPTTQSQEPRKPVDAPSHAPQPGAPETAEPPAVPSASLFPDGRYAHIWKNYKPPANPEEVGVRSVERVIDKYKERKDSVQRAAMENCALEQEELAHCFRTGDWQKRLKARVTLCSAENSNFARCFSTQAVSA